MGSNDPTTVFTNYLKDTANYINTGNTDGKLSDGSSFDYGKASGSDGDSYISDIGQSDTYVQANNDVLDGIRYTGSMLNDDKIRFSPECKNTIQEFSAYIWDKKAADKGEDKPVKDHDHAMDAVRYFCYTITRKKGGISVWKSKF